ELKDVPDTVIAELEVFGANDGAVHEEEAQRVGAEVVDNLDGVRVVAGALAHLATVVGKDEAVYNYCLCGGNLEKRSCEYSERVEPAAGLVEALADEVRRKALLECFLVLEGIVILRVGHGARFEPAVE